MISELMSMDLPLSDSDGTAELAIAGEEAGEGKHTLSKYGNNNKNTIKVETKRADTIVESSEAPSPSVVKIDVEGAELKVLRGMKNILRDSCRLVFVEVHPGKITEFGSKPSDISEYLKNAGFNVNKITDRGEEFFLRASK